MRGDPFFDDGGDAGAPFAAVEDAVMADVLGEVVALLRRGQVLGEQGWLGLFLWLLLHALGVWQMERIRWRFGKREGGNKSWQWGLATALQQSQIVYLVGALFVGIAYQPFIFMLIGLQCGLWSYVKRTSSEPAKASFKRPGSGELAREA